VTGEKPDEPAGPAWHERTSTLLAASVAALAALAVVYFLVSSLVRQFDEPDPEQPYFLDPRTSRSATTSGTATTTTQTITSTSPPVTTDINDPNAPSSTSGTDTSTSGTSGTDTSSSGATTTSRAPRTTDDDAPTSTRSRPRLNETRTLYPRP
jgi:hypothetical protein